MVAFTGDAHPFVDLGDVAFDDRFGGVDYVLGDGQHLVADAPAEYRGVVAVAQDHASDMVAACLPEGFGIDLGTAVARPHGGFVQHADTHFVGHIQIETRENLRMQAYGVGIGVPEHAVPRVGVPPRHLRNAHEVPRIALQLDHFVVEVEPCAFESELPPAEARVIPVGDSLPAPAWRRSCRTARDWRATISPAVRPERLAASLCFRPVRALRAARDNQGRSVVEVPCRDGK